MSAATNIGEAMDKFRLASRELFNHYFRVSPPPNNDGWAAEERFARVECVLFEELVTAPGGLSPIEYGLVNVEIQAVLSGSDFAPMMLNRDIDSGYWDYPIREVTKEATLLFVRYFDWDQLGWRDNRYVRVQVAAWPAYPETVGKHALVESQHVCFMEAKHIRDSIIT